MVRLVAHFGGDPGETVLTLSGVFLLNFGGSFSIHFGTFGGHFGRQGRPEGPHGILPGTPEAPQIDRKRWRVEGVLATTLPNDPWEGKGVDTRSPHVARTR